MSILVPIEDQNAVFGNVFDKARLLIIEIWDVRFNSGINGTIIRRLLCVKGLLFNIAHIILSRILFILFIDFKASGLGNIPTLPITAFTEFFLPDANIVIHPLPGNNSKALLCFICMNEN